MDASFSSILYGAIVSQLLDDLESVQEANKKLDELGYQLGQSLLDIYIAYNQCKCATFDEMKQKCFSALCLFYEQIDPWDKAEFEFVQGDATQFSIKFKHNTLETNVKIPLKHRGLIYSQIVAGAFRGAFRLLELDMKVEFLGSELKFNRLKEVREEIVKQE